MSGASGGYGYGNGFALIVVLFILLIVIGTSYVGYQSKSKEELKWDLVLEEVDTVTEDTVMGDNMEQVISVVVLITEMDLH